MLQLTQNDFSLKDSVQISISNSLVAIKGRVLDLQSATSQSGVERIVRMFCQWSTFLSSDGFARLEYSGPDLPLVGFSRTAQSCVFWSRPTIPHVTVVGESARPADHPDMLFFQGANNAYDPQVTTFCQTEQNSYRIKVYSYREAIQEGWLVERGNERAISWAKPLQLNLGFHSTEVSDFALTPTHFVPGFQSPSNPRTGDLP